MLTYPHDTSGKAAVVTGAGSGIGRQSARRLAEAGASVVVADVDADGGRETVDTIRSAGGEAPFVETDAVDPDDVAAMVDAAADAYGGPDIAHNNAGIEGDQSADLADQSEAD